MYTPDVVCMASNVNNDSGSSDSGGGSSTATATTATATTATTGARVRWADRPGQERIERGLVCSGWRNTSCAPSHTPLWASVVDSGTAFRVPQRGWATCGAGPDPAHPPPPLTFERVVCGRPGHLVVTFMAGHTKEWGRVRCEVHRGTGANAERLASVDLDGRWNESVTIATQRLITWQPTVVHTLPALDHTRDVGTARKARGSGLEERVSVTFTPLPPLPPSQGGGALPLDGTSVPAAGCLSKFKLLGLTCR